LRVHTTTEQVGAAAAESIMTGFQS
jgi:hypothetical protein